MSPGHDWSDDLLVVEREEAVRARWALAGRWTWLGVKSLVALAVPFFLLAGAFAPGFVRFPCRAMQSEAKGNLKALYVAEETYRAEHGSYTTDARAMEFEPRGVKRRYALFVRIVDGGSQFEAMAIGREGAEVTGDVWRIDPQAQLRHVVNACER